MEAVTADPLAPRCAGILAPGGYGKTTLLREVERCYREAGVEPVRVGRVMEDAREGAVLLVDDAHQLDAARLARLVDLARGGDARLVVTYRPWPRPTPLGELVRLVGCTGLLLALSPLDRTRTAAYLTTVLGAVPASAVVDFVCEQTGGVPRFVAWVAAAWGQAGRPAEESPDIPAAVVARLRPELEALDDDVQRYLLAAEAGMGLRTDLLGGLLGCPPERVEQVGEAARSAGLVRGDGTLVPLVRRAVRELFPAERRLGVRQRLAELQRAHGGPVLDLVRPLLGTGIGGGCAAEVFAAAAEEALPEEPALSARLFAAATSAGGPGRAVTVRWARAAALAGNLAPALRLADQVIACDDAPDRAEGAQVAAAVLAHRGQLGRSAELYRWAGVGSAPAFAVIGLVGTGRLTEAEQMLATSSGESAGTPPTLLGGAASLMAHGVRESVAGRPAAALPMLVRAATLLEPAGRDALLPDSPAALAALLALHVGELDIADAVLQRAESSGIGAGLMAPRHRLLRAWVAMVRGRTTQAAEHLSTVRAAGALEPRDWLFGIALDVGLARRASDLPGLRRAWEYGCAAVMQHAVDLFTLLPLGELLVAATRLGERDRLEAHLLEAWSLLERLGNPPVWTAVLRWSSLHAAVVADHQAEAAEQAAALEELAGSSRFATVAAAAARSWLAVMARKVDPDQVEDAARGLHGVGLCWDAVRLVGQAATHTSDRAAMVRLLDCARALKGRAAEPDRQATATVAESAPRSPAGVLSEREQEVARLVLDGLTYREVADRLFISAKTVEHHMARIRQRLGCANRSEVIAELRRLLGGGQQA